MFEIFEQCLDIYESLYIYIFFLFGSDVGVINLFGDEEKKERKY